MKRVFIAALIFISVAFGKVDDPTAWIRINQLGYKTDGIKVAVFCSKEKITIKSFSLIDAATNKPVLTSKPGQSFGNYGPFDQTYRLRFTNFKKPGRYFLQAGAARSPEFEIGDNVYNGAADFCLNYMRQQRSGFNPFLKDSCHTHDGYTLYGEKAGIKDSTWVNVVGGWHDASDYLQYATTSANASWHLLAAYRDFKNVFTDRKLSNGLDGKNGMADVLDEATWGLDWLLKMHPTDVIMFNQLGDDRDHQGMRIPKEDSFYGKGFQRPVYFNSGEPQQRGKFMNRSTGTASTAGKFASAFALGAKLFGNKKTAGTSQGEKLPKDFSDSLRSRCLSAYRYGQKKPGVAQTASVRSPYIYAEENWEDDMELAAAEIASLAVGADGQNNYEQDAYQYAKKEPLTPWLGKDTATHYQWYPFINIGHYELAKKLEGKQRDTIIGFYKRGIQLVWQKAKQNAFYRGIPFIWCSNNLTVSFAIQCYWYRQLTLDDHFSELEQANFDWLFGCNPWGTSFVYGLPANGDTPADPHSAFTHLKNYPIDGGLVDGPVYGSIYGNLIGITLNEPDEYALFQSQLAVYHDDYGDYSTNEPTMDGTASLIYLLAAKESETNGFSYDHGAIIRGKKTSRKIALVFTGDEFNEGGSFIDETLRQQKIKASFFLTGRFYSNPANQKIIQQLTRAGNYMGPHSNNHLLYCDWTNRDSLLVTKEQFTTDLLANLDKMNSKGINTAKARFFLPPYEWYNDSIANWTKELGMELINCTPGTLSHADYTTTDLQNYRDSKTILYSVFDFEKENISGLNGFILLIHIGAGPKRPDKFYKLLPGIITALKLKGYEFQTVGEMLAK